MTTTRIAFSSALVFVLSAFVCNAQRAPPGVVYDLVTLENGPDYSVCQFSGKLSQDEIEQGGNEQLQCTYTNPDRMSCRFADTCENLQKLCNNLDGQIVFSTNC